MHSIGQYLGGLIGGRQKKKGAPADPGPNMRSIEATMRAIDNPRSVTPIMPSRMRPGMVVSDPANRKSPTGRFVGHEVVAVGRTKKSKPKVEGDKPRRHTEVTFEHGHGYTTTHWISEKEAWDRLH